MKRPKAPLKPYAPYKPSKPLEYFPALSGARKTFSLDSYSTTLADVLKATEGVDPTTVTFEASGYGGCDDVSVDASFSWPDPNAKPTPNPYYKQQLAAYEKSFEKYRKEREKYEKDLATYETRLETYEKLNKEYLVWYYTKQLKALQK